jgi:hypothetical protein
MKFSFNFGLVVLIGLFCRVNSFSSKVLDRYFLVDPYAELLYCWSPKVASREALEFFKVVAPGYTQTQELPGQTASTEVWRPYTRVAMVRNPITRMLSGFLDKFNLTNRFGMFNTTGIFKGGKDVTWMDILDELGPKFPEDDLFKEFVSRVIVEANEHFVPQSSLCGLGDIFYDRILKLEEEGPVAAYDFMHNASDYHRLYSSVHGKYDVLAYHRHANRQVCKYYDAATMERVHILLGFDFRMMRRVGIEYPASMEAFMCV